MSRDEKDDESLSKEETLVQFLSQRYVRADPAVLLRAMIETEFRDRICVVSSFGSESGVLLHQVAQISSTVPVIFFNTGKLFGETLRYRDRLQTQFGLRDIRTIIPDNDDLSLYDSEGDLWQRDTDACCHIRKVLPKDHALQNFDAIITGRKRFQTTARHRMSMIEVDSSEGNRIRINPLADYDLDRLNAYILTHKLPRHPLVKDGYLSIGCMPCTSRVKTGEGYRSGRWTGKNKDECGLHKTKFVYGDGI